MNNYINVTIPEKIDFKLFGIIKEADKQKFLIKMCDDSINKPITKNGKAIGVITESKINELGDGIISFGKIQGIFAQEFIENKNEYSFSVEY